MSQYINSTHRFLLNIGEPNDIAVQEVTIPSNEVEVITYITGNVPDSGAPATSPGRQKFSQLTFKKGAFKNDTTFFDWANAVRTDPTAKRTIIVTLLDEQGQPAMTWTFPEAWPSKISGVSLNAATSAAMVEDFTFEVGGMITQYI
ncbi:phage tail protein [Aquimarina longa]|uniref:phage tail protein n=1 Tax=Aquimarina longa TaxID=1080221 RepID=UPI000782ED04|nr:phage tail protein [Aquimarina longa]